MQPYDSTPLAAHPMVVSSPCGATGFSLIQLSIILTISALLMAAMIPGKETGDVNRKALDDNAKLAKVEDAMKAFMAFNGRRPCPADGQYTVNVHDFGMEAANPGTCIGDSPAAPLGPDAGTGNVVAGVIPTKSLNIPDELAFDSYGRRFTYAVDVRATAQTSCWKLQGPNHLGTGGIVIEDGTGAVTDNVMAAYIGHGADGHGAWPIQSNGNGGPMANGTADNQRLNSGSIDPDTLNNANVDVNFNVNFDNVLVKKDRTATFDDLVYYEQPTKNNCCVGQFCQQIAFRADGDITAGYGEGAGNAVAVGDVNGDGIPDLIIGASGSALGNQWNAGATYVVFGTTNGFPDPLPLSSLDGTNGFRIDGQMWDYSGSNVAVGDINRDGIADIVITAPTASPNGQSGAGRTYVVFGHSGAWPASLSVTSLNGTNGFELDGTVAAQSANVGSWSPENSLAVGDINGDGYGDIIIGNTGDNFYQSSGWISSVYVVFGHPGPWPAVTLLSSLDGTNGFRIDGPTGNDEFGYAVAAGDINGDGIDDLLIGAPARTQWSNPAGNSYLIYGKATGWAASVTADSTFINGTNGFQISSDQWWGDGAGTSVAIADVNGDGVKDIAIGAYYTYEFFPDGGLSTGTISIIYGQKSGSWPAWIGLADSYFTGTNGFRIRAAEGNYWLSLANWGTQAFAIGDFNGDGVNDFVIGDSYMWRNGGNSGLAWVVFGKPGTQMPAIVTLDNTVINGINGFELDGPSAGYYLPSAVAAGDINGDGISDIILGDDGANPNNLSGGGPPGSVYVMFGYKNGPPAQSTYWNVGKF